MSDSRLIPVDRCRTALLDWYDENRRDLPWRSASDETPDPYHVWVSEVMLQQTRVETVKPYFERWIARFPDLESLAAADQDEVLKMWEGLGYYSRARNLHRAVREVTEVHGEVPDDPEGFRALPGVGRYTAGAVLSIAFGQRQPIVDGNVRRVFARLTDDPAPADKALWSLASEFADSSRPGDVNQGLMELGATVCTPRSPSCPGCCLKKWCHARKAGTQTERPARKVRRERPVEKLGVVVLEAEGRVALRKRPATGRLAGMWEFPSAAVVDGRGPEEAALRAARDLTRIEESSMVGLGEIVHIFTHVTVHYHAFRVSARRVPPQPEWSERVVWPTIDEVDGYALPTAQRKILTRLRNRAEAGQLR